MTRALRFETCGGPEVMSLQTVALAAPGLREARVRHTAIGVNFIDVYHRTGLYPLPLPSGLGLEAAGVVEAIGPGVTEVAVGDRVGYAGGAPGAYAEARLIAADRLVRIPAGLDDATVAGAIFKGMTAQYLLRSTYRVQAGETVLFHAAAGGVGLIAGQWLKALGVTAIGTVGTEEKAELARRHGYEHVVVYTKENFVERVREITGGRGVPVVYDSVGKDTFMGSLDCLRPRGLLVSFGNGSGPVPPFDLTLLSRKGSLYVTRPTLMAYTAERADLERASAEVFGMIQGGQVRIEVRQTYALADAAQAHRDLEARKTTGSSVLLP